MMSGMVTNVQPQDTPSAQRTGGARSWAAVAVAVALTAAGCSLDEALPPNVSDPAITQTPAGALNAYYGTLAGFRQAFGGEIQFASFVAVSALLSDELVSAGGNELDRRTLPVGSTAGDPVYSNLHKVRGQASQALGLLADFRPEEPPLRSHLYALEGYAELFLAELFCSGVPLGTLDYKGNYTYQPGSTTEAVFAHAQALFDTALTLAGDSARVADLARVGRARALLGRGEYAAAAAAVAPVATSYAYRVAYDDHPMTDPTGSQVTAKNFAGGRWSYAVPDREGGNGLDWIASGDPRTRVTSTGLYGPAFTLPQYHPDKYDTNGTTPIVLASGVEARLIEAEAAFQANSTDGQWLATLNALRTDGTQDGNGVYQPGGGGVAGLAPLVDPGTPAARVDLLFRERAFWLFLTGHRQGDLRRLIRQYGRLSSTVYPTGAYFLGSYYGSDFKVPISTAEAANPLFTGCQPGD